MKWIIFLAFVVVAVCDVAPPVGIYKQASEINPDGSYQWSFEAENGITAEESGHLTDSKEPGTEAQGRYQYTAPDGTPVIVDYIANEGGFQPQGDLLPTPPPIPLAIARALDWIAAHPEPENQS